MLHIAVCDDDRKDLKRQTDLLRAYASAENTPDISVEPFCEGDALLTAVREGKLYDIYVLDMLMPGTNGVALGEAVREMGSTAPILYLTSSREHALQAYSVQALRYLVKPVEQKELFEALDCALRNLPQKFPLFTIKTKEALVSVRLNEIVYVENQARALYLVLADGRALRSVSIRCSFEECLAPLLASGDFLQPHKSFVVNLAFIRRMTAGELELQGGDTVPISRNNQALVKSCYLKYLAAKGRGHE